jgi:uncharacterized protein HemX
VESPRNGDKSYLMGVAAALGIAAITGIIGWTFGHVVDLSTAIEHTSTAQQGMAEHNVQQDKWIDELNKKMEANQNETRAAINNVKDLLNSIKARLDEEKAPSSPRRGP